jgi:hypothetical protein
MFEYQSSPAFIQVEQQNQRHEIARLSQFIFELEHHVATIHNRLAYLGQVLATPEQRLEYAQLLMDMNSGMGALHKHRETLQAMLALTQSTFGKQIPDHCRREIYHLYHAGRYTQEQLAGQYGVSQSAVSKIVNGPIPGPIAGVNPQGVAG